MKYSMIAAAFVLSLAASVSAQGRKPSTLRRFGEIQRGGP